jgi:hypothetical protein
LIAASREHITGAHDAALSSNWRVRNRRSDVSLIGGSSRNSNRRAHDGGGRASRGKQMADVTLDARSISAGLHDGAASAAARNGAQDWLTTIEKSNLTPRYYATIVLIVFQEMFEFYDFFLVGYLVSVLAPGWHLTYGQSAMMLLSSGVGAIAGAVIGGRFADIVGRKKMVWAAASSSHSARPASR